MHTRLAVLAAALAVLAAPAVLGQAPPPPPFSLDFAWTETPATATTSTKTPAVRWHIWGRQVTRTEEWPPEQAGAAPRSTSTEFSISGEEMNALIDAVPAFKKGKIDLPPNPKKTATVSTSLVVNGSVLAIGGDLPADPAPAELTAARAIHTLLEKAYAASQAKAPSTPKPQAPSTPSTPPAPKKP